MGLNLKINHRHVAIGYGVYSLYYIAIIIILLKAINLNFTQFIEAPKELHFVVLLQLSVGVLHIAMAIYLWNIIKLSSFKQKMALYISIGFCLYSTWGLINVLYARIYTNNYILKFMGTDPIIVHSFKVLSYVMLSAMLFTIYNSANKSFKTAAQKTRSLDK